MGRYMAFFAVFWLTVLQSMSANYPIMVSRDWETRQQIFLKMKQYLQTVTDKTMSRIVVYIEGTRRRHLTIDSPSEARSYFKFGVLRSIFEDDDNLPCQVMISSNKEMVFDEKMLSIQYGVGVKTSVGVPIYPKDYQTFDDFVDAVAVEWHRCWNVAYSGTAVANNCVFTTTATACSLTM